MRSTCSMSCLTLSQQSQQDTSQNSDALTFVSFTWSDQPIMSCKLCKLVCMFLQVQQESHIQHATQLEQRLMEGAYNKVLSAKNNVPDQSYLYFMEKLVSTVR